MNFQTRITSPVPTQNESNTDVLMDANEEFCGGTMVADVRKVLHEKSTFTNELFDAEIPLSH